MKRLDLYIEGERFIVEECEGSAEIRRATEPKANASKYSAATVRSNGVDVTIGVKVELVE